MCIIYTLNTEHSALKNKSKKQKQTATQIQLGHIDKMQQDKNKNL